MTEKKISILLAGIIIFAFGSGILLGGFIEEKSMLIGPSILLGGGVIAIIDWIRTK